MKLPSYFRHVINIKDGFKQWVSAKKPKGKAVKNARGMTGMLDALGLELVGRHHSGIDDSRNIAAILQELARQGVTFLMAGGARG